MASRAQREADALHGKVAARAPLHSPNPLIMPAGKRCSAARDLEFGKERQYDVAAKRAARGEGIDIARIETEMIEQGSCCARQPWRGGRWCRRARDAKFLKYVLGGFDQLCSLFDQVVAALGER